ncbi:MULTISPECIES: Coq4 family protein [Sphingomonadales]|uniref:Ubiquinone biosynthesis protein n=2 Tax=Edaphosphingomonas TaxID=3423724 RepID=A0A2T4HR36_9SPHN|nr:MULTISPECIES: Coq4 family protein [Sphingomonas]AGH48503.1 hypothetical protein G432_03880 [Sphingomonas sp. MM-1]MDX3883319.1 Coq4 family protein [Sphingomonas sp.]OHT20976.1 hypothetical protein BHE75_02981 [Sphingomonas haloaromaticamans]PTD18281.1 hypothetical protein CV103_15320 [Sphingomonas fennica]
MNKPIELNKEESSYLMGAAEPAKSSVLISTSKYLNNPLFRDIYAQFGLKRDGHDLPAAYLIPELSRAFGEVTDYARVFAALEAEKARIPEFAAWLDERYISNFTAELVEGRAPGTLGALIHDFIVKSGLAIDFMYKDEPKNDFDFLVKRRVQNHDIEHMVTGLDPSPVGEIALIAANTVANSNYFQGDLVHELNAYGSILTATSISRAGLHYPDVLPTLLEGLARGYAVGAKQKKPFFMIRWEDYLDWQVSDIREEFNFQDGPELGAWEWTYDAFRG